MVVLKSAIGSTNPKDNNYVYSIANIAGLHISSMRKHQPVGPYAVVGYFFGSIVSFEIGQRLEASNRRLDFLSLWILLGTCSL